MIRLLLDQGLPRSTSQHLSGTGWDIEHVGNVGLSTADDARVIEFARHENRICVTLDADFHALLATSGATSPSVIRIRREGLNAKALAGLLNASFARITEAISKGALVTITERSIRIRLLPIERKKQ